MSGKVSYLIITNDNIIVTSTTKICQKAMGSHYMTTSEANDRHFLITFNSTFWRSEFELLGLFWRQLYHILHTRVLRLNVQNAIIYCDRISKLCLNSSFRVKIVFEMKILKLCLNSSFRVEIVFEMRILKLCLNSSFIVEIVFEMRISKLCLNSSFRVEIVFWNENIETMLEIKFWSWDRFWNELRQTE